VSVISVTAADKMLITEGKSSSEVPISRQIYPSRSGPQQRSQVPGKKVLPTSQQVGFDQDFRTC